MSSPPWRDLRGAQCGLCNIPELEPSHSGRSKPGLGQGFWKIPCFSLLNRLLPKYLYALKKFCHYSEPSMESGGDAVLPGGLSHKKIPPTSTVVTYLGLDRPYRC